jgi:hypothetical protein
VLGRVQQFLRGQWIYLAHVVSLVAPGRDVPTFRSDQLKPRQLDGWTGDDFRLLIDEGRRQVDRQQSDLENIRARAQWLFTVGAAALAALGGGYVNTHPSSGAAVLWLAGMVLLVYGVGGAAAILTVKADFNVIHAAVLSASTPPVDKALASSYARMMSMGENTVATRLTVFRQAVVFSLVGGYFSLLAVLIAG